ncbi:MAG: hypothetical protein AB8E87_08695 [Prochlorococcus sp.]
MGSGCFDPEIEDYSIEIPKLGTLCPQWIPAAVVAVFPKEANSLILHKVGRVKPSA